MVLDGHIFSLFGLYDFVRAVSEKSDKKSHELAKKLFDDGVESLINYLPEFDMDYWFRFNLCKMEHYPEIDPCTIGYLRLIIHQFNILHQITNQAEILIYLKKLKKYDKISNIVKMYFEKYKALKKLSRL